MTNSEDLGLMILLLSQVILSVGRTPEDVVVVFKRLLNGIDLDYVSNDG